MKFCHYMKNVILWQTDDDFFWCSRNVGLLLGRFFLLLITLSTWWIVQSVKWQNKVEIASKYPRTRGAVCKLLVFSGQHSKSTNIFTPFHKEESCSFKYFRNWNDKLLQFLLDTCKQLNDYWNCCRVISCGLIKTHFFDDKNVFWANMYLLKHLGYLKSFGICGLPVVDCE